MEYMSSGDTLFYGSVKKRTVSCKCSASVGGLTDFEHENSVSLVAFVIIEHTHTGLIKLLNHSPSVSSCLKAPHPLASELKLKVKDINI